MPFGGIVGHPPPGDPLPPSVRGGPLPPSLIFAGPSGVGKRLVATALGQALNCTSPSVTLRDNREPAVDACGRCAACTRIARGTHPDVPIIEPGESGAIKIDQVREI